jgi:hypothetical protein
MTALSAGQMMQYAEEMVMNAVTLYSQSPAAGTSYLALSTAPVAPTGSALNSTETAMNGTTVHEYLTPGSQGYSRASFTMSSGASAASPSVIENTSTLTWGPFTGSISGTLTWGILCDASTSSTAHPLIAYLLSSTRTPQTGDSVQAAADAFTAQV